MDAMILNNMDAILQKQQDAPALHSVPTVLAKSKVTTATTSQPNNHKTLLAPTNITAKETNAKSMPQEPNDWKWPQVHTVRTRFMQNQGNLTTLARARLELFKTFCLPTMKAQTTQQFLWIIRTDPNLDQSIIDEMVDLLKDHPNFYLVGCNTNGDTFKEVKAEKIYTGNRTLYLAAEGAQKHVPVIDSGLDADDGLHKGFFQDIQGRVRLAFTRDKLKWLMFCSQTAMEWRVQPNMTYGSFAFRNERSNWCITPGLTVARNVGVSDTPIETPFRNHAGLPPMIFELPQKHSCGYNKTPQCLVILNGGSKTGPFTTIRPRTPTSTGMKDVMQSDEQLSKEARFTNARLNTLQDDFRIPRDGLKWLNTYLEEHIFDIAKENLEGQCTPDNSCKVCIMIVGAMRQRWDPGNRAALTLTFSRFLFSCRALQRSSSKEFSLRMVNLVQSDEYRYVVPIPSVTVCAQRRRPTGWMSHTVVNRFLMRIFWRAMQSLSWTRTSVSLRIR
jgi:hypothetical protein